MKIIFIIIISSLTLACGQNPESSDAHCPQLQTYDQRLVTFGDSQTMGRASAINGCPFSWAYALAEDEGLTLVNKAIGATTIDLASVQGPSQISQIENTAFNNTDLVFWILGFNDAQYNGPDQNKLSEFKIKLIEQIQYIAPKVEKLYIGSPFKPIMYYFNGSPESFEAYATAIEEAVTLLNLTNVVFINTQEDFTPTPDLFDEGLGHINPNGQVALTNYIKSVL